MIRLWPRSLAGQLMLVTALALLLAQGVNLVLLARGQQQERLNGIASGAATQIVDTSERLAAGMSAGWTEERTERARRVLRRHGNDDGTAVGPRMRRVIVADKADLPDGLVRWPQLEERVSAYLAEAGVPVRSVSAGYTSAPRSGRAMTEHGRNAQLVGVAAQLHNGQWVTVRARVGAPQRIGTLLAIQTVVLLILLLVPLLFFAWRVTRPLATLARAAAGTRPGQAEEPVPESGPEDVRSLTRAFNDMRQRILAMLTDKDRMLGAIGHDLRTPLASLRVRVEQVEDERLRDRMVGTIEEMAGMLDDILSLARAGQPREAAEPTDLAGLIGDTVADYQTMGQPVSLAAEGAVATRNLRPLSLRRALRNLIDNAVKYGGQATVGLSERADGAVVIAVDDNGPGIPPDRIGEMMEPFARAEESRNRDTGGTGLGLALARSIAQGEGGTLELVNRPEGGLSARIVLGRE